MKKKVKGILNLSKCDLLRYTVQGHKLDNSRQNLVIIVGIACKLIIVWLPMSMGNYASNLYVEIALAFAQ